MKNLILMMFVVLSFYSCTDISDTNIEDCGNTTNVAYGSFSYCGALKENPKQPSFLIINSADEMQKLFTTCETFDVALPDFTQKRILGLFAGPKPTAGYAIKIQSVVEDNCQIIVEYFEKEPHKEDIVAQVITYPADYVVLPKSSKPIFFKKVNEIRDYVVIGTYFGKCTGVDCQQFYKIESEKVVHYLNVNYGSFDFNQYHFKTLVYRDDLVAFLQKVPTEIVAIKGQTKTYGTPDSHDQGGVYVELRQGDVLTKIYLDNDDTTDQSQNVILFKNFIQDKITELKTKS